MVKKTATAGQAGICSRSTSATTSLCPPCCPYPGRSRRTRTNTIRRSPKAEDKLNSGELTFFVYTILGLIERAQESLIEELVVKIDQLDKATVLRDELRKEHALSTNATLLLYAVMQEELFDTTKSMTLEDAGGDLI